jgi:hypothetical protein
MMGSQARYRARSALLWSFPISFKLSVGGPNYKDRDFCHSRRSYDAGSAPENPKS